MPWSVIVLLTCHQRTGAFDAMNASNEVLEARMPSSYLAKAEGYSFTRSLVSASESAVPKMIMFGLQPGFPTSRPISRAAAAIRSRIS